MQKPKRMFVFSFLSTICSVIDMIQIRPLLVMDFVALSLKDMMSSRCINTESIIILSVWTPWTFLWDWVQDKIHSKFAFAAMCWEKSYVPLSIWRAGESNSNLIESVHADVSKPRGREVHSYWWGQKGQAFDAMKMRILKVCIMYMNHLKKQSIGLLTARKVCQKIPRKA